MSTINKAASKWMPRRYDEGLANQLETSLDISTFLSQNLASRGVTDLASTQDFLEPRLSQLRDPFSFADMKTAARLLSDTISRGEVIGVYGDYDVDGVCGTVQLVDFIRRLGGQAIYYIPNRLKEGYGLNKRGVDTLAEQHASLLITVDCGISAHEEVAYAKEKGLAVIVIDHHQVSDMHLPADAVINPHQPGCPSGGLHLCAAAVAFYFTAAVKRTLEDDGLQIGIDLRDNLDVVALATVADVMPLQHENRVFVAYGLNQIRRRRRLGINMLLEVAGVDVEHVRAGQIGFQIGPRINAIGRLDQAHIAVELLLTEFATEARQGAMTLEQANQSRRNIERETVEAAIQQIETVYAMPTEAAPNGGEHFALIVADAEWHPGVVGIVASRLVDRYGRPVIVIGRDGKGSGRSIPAFNLYHALCECDSWLLGYGGHSHAAGIHISMERLAGFRTAFSKVAAEMLDGDALTPMRFFDISVEGMLLNQSYWDDVDRLQPVGFGCPTPIIHIPRADLKHPRELKGGHMKWQLDIQDGVIDVLRFGAAKDDRGLRHGDDIFVHLGVNTWNGRLRRQLIVQDFREALPK